MSIRVDLARLFATAHTHNATINDILLSAIGGALHQLLDARGEALDDFVISVPFSARQQSTASELGNQSGVIPLAIPGVGDPRRRLAAVAKTTQAAKLEPPGDSTSLRGPVEHVDILGLPIISIVPLSVNTGNVTVSFSALSYAGSLIVTIATDPDACPDLALLERLLIEQMTTLMALDEHDPVASSDF